MTSQNRYGKIYKGTHTKIEGWPLKEGEVGIANMYYGGW